jgi:hypothetical protein
MDIGVNKRKELEFLLYRSDAEIRLSLADLQEIISRANDFLPGVIKEHEDFLSQ